MQGWYYDKGLIYFRQILYYKAKNYRKFITQSNSFARTKKSGNMSKMR